MHRTNWSRVNATQHAFADPTDVNQAHTQAIGMSDAGSALGQGIGGLLAAGLIAGYAHRRGALSPGGAVAATAVGATVVAAGGWSWGALMVAFFASSSVLSLLRVHHGPTETVSARGHRRDAVQVLANGGLATAAAVTSSFTSSSLVLAIYAGALAGATADTWATEIGGMMGTRPRLITSGRPVPAGTSGGITAAGLLGAIAGAMLLGSLATVFVRVGWAGQSDSPGRIFVGAALGGIAGSLIDSLLGATVQLQYRCSQCGEMTERRIHRCGAATVRARGLPGITNDTVNALATLTGGVVAIVAVIL